MAATYAFSVHANLAKADPLVSSPAELDVGDWEHWKQAFLAEDGRVIDHLQENASHSEGQGYGMLLATWFGDEQTFLKMHQWTSQFLAVRRDPLLAWRWSPQQHPQISDYNNATDGDLFYAWALLRAGRRFGAPDYLTKAQEIARFIARSCIHADPRGGGRLLLLPGAERFAAGGEVTVNPSYYMPLAMRELGLATLTPDLLRCADDGEVLLEELAAVGPIPNWVDVGPSGWRYSRTHGAQSGYDALRAALFLIWSGRSDHGAVRRAAQLYATAEGNEKPVPVVIEPSGQNVLTTSDLPGYVAVAALVRCADGASQHSAIPKFVDEQPYFPATLHLFSHIAAKTVGLTC
ncbi:glycosyl hydrolase family 8 [Cypionkella sp.]|uniref:glycosyl hydrolase family 8 n=1 Tax=Cypionkella sp. TaxID=2811411 RepID=UPI002AC93135|nr:glycosyl hydrolase family 8 [Cypionkella sp.]